MIRLPPSSIPLTENDIQSHLQSILYRHSLADSLNNLHLGANSTSDHDHDHDGANQIVDAHNFNSPASSNVDSLDKTHRHDSKGENGGSELRQGNSSSAGSLAVACPGPMTARLFPHGNVNFVLGLEPTSVSLSPLIIACSEPHRNTFQVDMTPSLRHLLANRLSAGIRIQLYEPSTAFMKLNAPYVERIQSGKFMHFSVQLFPAKHSLHIGSTRKPHPNARIQRTRSRLAPSYSRCRLPLKSISIDIDSVIGPFHNLKLQETQTSPIDMDAPRSCSRSLQSIGWVA